MTCAHGHHPSDESDRDGEDECPFQDFIFFFFFYSKALKTCENKPKQRKETASAVREHMLSAALAFEIISTSVESVTCCSATA